jgi:NADPH-dependent 2,4-dienoyl-CoA reductase/sulfur reductase-like enzyme
VVVVGASLAGLRACEALRQDGFDGTVTLVGAEAEIPYDRPPLSKKLLAGEWEPDRIRLRKPDDFASLALDLRLGVRAAALDTEARLLALSDGSSLGYDGLVIATGAAPRRLPGQPDTPAVVTLRTLADSLALRDRLGDGHRLVVIGAGFIGLEVAATARQRGCEVTVLEGLPAPMVRGLGSTLGAAVAGVHARNGVDVRCGVQVADVTERDDGAVDVTLGDGGRVVADTVLVAIGVAPTVGWLDGSGLTVGDGLVCDVSLGAGAPGVYAAGDCVRWPNGAFVGDDGGPEEMRVEHWTNASEQGAAAARNLLAELRGEQPLAFESVPFFWSDQFDSRIQFVGRARGDDDVHVFSGDPATGPFAALFGHGGRLRGVLGVSSPKLVMPFRALLAAKASWAEALAKAADLTA